MIDNQQKGTIYIVRHGETDWNTKKVTQSHIDVPLNETGIEQAYSLAQQLEDIRFEAIFSSDLSRASKTAEIIATERKLEIKTSEKLRGRDFGQFEGKPKAALKELDEAIVGLTNQEKLYFKGFEMESDAEVIERVFSLFQEIITNYQDKTVLIVTHETVIRAILIHLKIGNYSTILPGAVGNGAEVRLAVRGEDFTVEEIKDINIS